MTDQSPAENTFRAYTTDQSSNYAKYRRGYPPELLKHIFHLHSATGGQFDTVLDAGCGPGPALRGLAPQFKHAIGLDASPSMIEAGRGIGGTTNTSEPIRFEISSAEDLGSKIDPPIADNSVDLIVASSAAHWFDMAQFWPRAAQVLKPGGTVAFWNRITARVDSSTPNYEAIQRAYDEWAKTYLIPYYAPGNFIEKGEYIDLLLPWTLEQPVAGFDERLFHREIWQQRSSGGESAAIDLDTLEMALGTISPVTRWREAHPEDVGTERDAVRILRRTLEKLLREVDFEDGKEVLREESPKVVLLMVKKSGL